MLRAGSDQQVFWLELISENTQEKQNETLRTRQPDSLRLSCFLLSVWVTQKSLQNQHVGHAAAAGPAWRMGVFVASLLL